MIDYERFSAFMQRFTENTIRVMQRLEARVQKLSLFFNSASHSTVKKEKAPTEAHRVRWPVAILLGLLFTPLSAYSLCLFHFMRTAEGVEAYYATPSLSLAAAVFQSQKTLFFILLPLLFGVYLFSLAKNGKHLLASWLTSLPLAFNMVVTLSMEHSNLKQIFLPSDSLLSQAALNAAALLGFSSLLAAGILWIFSAIDRQSDHADNLLRTTKSLKTIHP